MQYSSRDEHQILFFFFLSLMTSCLFGLVFFRRERNLNKNVNFF